MVILVAKILADHGSVAFVEIDDGIWVEFHNGVRMILTPEFL
jgi:hypothetical protein